jgi:hypothetical protein
VFRGAFQLELRPVPGLAKEAKNTVRVYTPRELERDLWSTSDVPSFVCVVNFCVRFLCLIEFWLGFGTQFRTVERVSKVKHNTLEPVWEEKFMYPIKVRQVYVKFM